MPVHHSGSCNDSVLGCIICYNQKNNGKGTLAECEWCGKEDFLRITPACDEPICYALCLNCRKKQTAYIRAEELADGERRAWASDSYGEDVI